MSSSQMGCSLLLIVVLAGAANAGPTVYKCQVGNNVSYSDEPCPGAIEVDVTPTRGLDKSTGVQRTGADVARERQREQFADAIQPLTGMNAQQLAIYQRRQKLSAGVQLECRSLDRDLVRLKADEAAQRGAERSAVQAALFAQRRKIKDLGC
jgi:hypothetical protein